MILTRCGRAFGTSRRMPQYQPIFLKEDITPDELQFIEAHRNELPELDTIMAHRRLYPRNGFMAHLIGYVGEVSEDMLNQPQFELYNAGDVVGISGVERQYNTLLMGHERIAPGPGRQPRPRSRTAGRDRRGSRQTTSADRRYRSSDCRRRSSGGKEWSHRGHGSAHRRNSRHGERADLRSQ